MIKKDMVAMVFAGGQTSRLGILTDYAAKPAAAFGGKYRIIDFALSNCINSGIDTVGVLPRCETPQLTSHIGIGIPWDLDKNEGGVTLLPPFGRNSDGAAEDPGTADAMRMHMDYVRQYRPDYVLLISGDHIYKMDYEVMLDYHRAQGADVTVAVRPALSDDAGGYGIAVTDQAGRIISFSEKVPAYGGCMASIGICIFSTEALERAMAAMPASGQHSFAADVLPWCCESGMKVSAYEFNGYWRNVDTLGAYWEANMELVDIIPEFNLYEEFWRIYTKNDVIPPQYISSDSYIFRALIGNGSEVYGNVENSIIGENVVIGQGASVRDSIVMNGAVIGAGALLEKAIVSENAVIGENALIGCGEYLPNRERPDIYAYGLAVLGEEAVIPPGVRIGRNTVVTGRTVPEDYPDGLLSGGETLRGEGAGKAEAAGAQETAAERAGEGR